MRCVFNECYATKKRPYTRCSRNGKVKREGRWYCGQHDPDPERENMVGWVGGMGRRLPEPEYHRRQAEAQRFIIKSFRRHREQWPEARKKIIAQIGYEDLGPLPLTVYQPGHK